MTQTINVTAGDTDYVRARVTERQGKSLEDTTWQVALGGYEPTARPTTWLLPLLVETVSDSEVIVSLFVDADTDLGKDRYLWVLASDLPTHRAIRAGNDSITII